MSGAVPEWDSGCPTEVSGDDIFDLFIEKIFRNEIYKPRKFLGATVVRLLKTKKFFRSETLKQRKFLGARAINWELSKRY